MGIDSARFSVSNCETGLPFLGFAMRNGGQAISFSTQVKPTRSLSSSEIESWSSRLRLNAINNGVLPKRLNSVNCSWVKCSIIHYSVACSDSGFYDEIIQFNHYGVQFFWNEDAKVFVCNYGFYDLCLWPKVLNIFILICMMLFSSIGFVVSRLD